MYGWLRGIIFSKLAPSVRRQTASAPSSTVRIAQTTITVRRLLNTARSSSEPPSARSGSAGAGAAVDMVACTVFPSGDAQRRGAARAGEHERVGGGGDDRRGGKRSLDLDGREARAVVAADEDMTGLADEHDAAALVDRRAGQADVDAGGDARPRAAAVGAAHDVAAQAEGDDRALGAGDAEQRPLVGQRHRNEPVAVALELEREALLADDE